MSLKILMGSVELKRRSSVRVSTSRVPMPCLAAVDTYERMAQNAPGKCGHGMLCLHRCRPGFLKGIGALRCGEASGRPDGRPGRLDEQHVRGRNAGVLARVGLGWSTVLDREVFGS